MISVLIFLNCLLCKKKRYNLRSFALKRLKKFLKLINALKCFLGRFLGHRCTPSLSLYHRTTNSDLACNKGIKSEETEENEV